MTTTNATIFDCPKFQSAMFNTPVGVTVGDAIGVLVTVGEFVNVDVIVGVLVGVHVKVGVQVGDCAGPTVNATQYELSKLQHDGFR